MRDDYPLAVLCEALEVNRSSLYCESARADDGRLEKAIVRLAGQWPVYGHRRVAAMLAREGRNVNRKKVLRLMREMNLTAKRPARKVRTTDSKHGFPRYPNLVEGLRIRRPNQVWAADITYVRLGSGHVFLAVVLDVFTRSIRGWHLSASLDTTLTLVALRKALRKGRCEIHHSDQGVQYASREYVEELGPDVAISMAEAGEAWQNGYAERVVRTIKEEEVVDLSEYVDMNDARRRMGRFIETTCNRKRIHSSLGYLTPGEFEDRHRSTAPGRGLTRAESAP